LHKNHYYSMEIKKNISLIGMPAAGKTTIGKLLAEQTGYRFIDSDDIIQSGENATLAQIIAEKGLERFLEIEENHVAKISCSNHIIATGGSVVYRPKAMHHLSDISTIVYLHATLETLLPRLSDVRARGVAMGRGKTIEDLYKERTPLYDRWCDMKIDCSSMTADQIVKKLKPCLFPE